MRKPDETIHYQKYRLGRWEELVGSVIVEMDVSLAVNGESWLTLMCTPTELKAMGVGFLFNEGVLSNTDEIVSVDVCAAGDQIDIWLNHLVKKPENWRKTSGCSGGMTTIDALPTSAEPITAVQIEARQITGLMSQFLQTQDLYRQTRGVHSSALSNGKEILLQAEDIGRHNTLDKLAGRYLLDHLDISPRILLTTGRISSEMLQKAYRIGAFLVISRTAANSLSIRMAQDLGIALIGYARRDEFLIYTHPEYIRGASLSSLIPLSQDHLSE